MRTVASLLGAGLLVLMTGPLGAQSKPSAEIGTSLGVTILSSSGNTVTSVGVPADAGPVPVFARPTIYATIFASPSVMIEPQVSFASISGSGNSLTMAHLGVQLGYLFTPAARNSPYVGANAAFQSISAGATANGLGLGGAVGYRVRVGAGFAVRFEGRYRRWLNDYDGINEFGLAIGLGGIL